MNQSELIIKTAQASGVSKKDVEKVLKAATAAISAELQEGGSAALTGLGTLSVNQRKARTGHNPKTKEPIQIPAKKVPHFSAAKALKDAVGGAK